MYNYPYMRPGLFSRLSSATKAFNFSSFLDGTQKTLGVINQAIPIVYQVKPIFQNAKTMFRIADEIRKPIANENTYNNSSSYNSRNNSNNAREDVAKNKPIFYI